MTLSTGSDVSGAIRDCFGQLPDDLVPCQISGNNRSFRFAVGNVRYIIKYYFQDQTNKRDRLYHEARFLDYLAALGMTNVPALIHENPVEQYAVFTFKAGRTPDKITDHMVGEAGRFIVRINNTAHKALMDTLPMASEPLQSVGLFRDHIAKRIAILKNQQDAMRRYSAFAALVAALESAFDDQSNRLVQAEREHGRGVFWDTPDYIASPSDFGFHNVLQEENGSCHFIDFEYAGRDDIAKLYCDFLLHPGHRLKTRHTSLFRQAVTPLIDQASSLRIHLAYPLTVLKWACICCNIFVPEWLERRKFSNPELDLTVERENQLKKAYGLLERISDHVIDVKEAS